jgi:orotidine-5'-phosphate decarboxylase
MQLIIALDGMDETTALGWADAWDPTWCALKVGNESFTRFGPSFVRALIAKDFNVFLDLKYHDISNTVASACKAAADLGVWMLNVHAAGGIKMMQAAREAVEEYGDTRPLLIAVTVLTSLGSDDLAGVGINKPLLQQVKNLSELAKQANLDGVVCSALEVPELKAVCGQDFLTVTPGIRLEGDATHDQVRCVTPELATELGSDYGVIGRSITRAMNPTERLRQLVEENLK